MYCVISKSLQHTFLACKKDLRRRIESKVFVFNLFEYLSLTYVTRLKHPPPRLFKVNPLQQEKCKK